MNDYLEKKKSKIHGYGVFTKKRLEKGEVVYRVPLRKIFLKNRRECAYIGEGKYVHDNKVLNLVNHSCKPNCILDITGRPPVLIAKKQIAAGEEITCDYNKTEIDRTTFRFDCNCEKCHKTT